MRNIKVGDNLSGKQLYLNFPNDLDLGNVSKQIILSESGYITQTQANIIEMGLNSETSTYESVELFNDGSGGGTAVNLITCIVPEDFGVVTSIDETSPAYQYIMFSEEDNYVRCGSHCKHSSYTKEEIDFLLVARAKKNDVYSQEEIDNLLLGKANNSNIYSKTEIDTMFSNEPDVYSGTTDPDSSLGKDGDIYFQYS